MLQRIIELMQLSLHRRNIRLFKRDKFSLDGQMRATFGKDVGWLTTGRIVGAGAGAVGCGAPEYREAPVNGSAYVFWSTGAAAA